MNGDQKRLQTKIFSQTSRELQLPSIHTLVNIQSDFKQLRSTERHFFLFSFIELNSLD